jgi:hypothetical protein
MRGSAAPSVDIKRLASRAKNRLSLATTWSITPLR